MVFFIVCWIFAFDEIKWAPGSVEYVYNMQTHYYV